MWPHSPPKRSGTAGGRGGSSRKNATAPGTETLLRPPRTPGSKRAWSRSRSWSSSGAFWSSWVCGLTAVVAGRGPRRAGKSSGTMARSSHARTRPRSAHTTDAGAGWGSEPSFGAPSCTPDRDPSERDRDGDGGGRVQPVALDRVGRRAARVVGDQPDGRRPGDPAGRVPEQELPPLHSGDAGD